MRKTISVCLMALLCCANVTAQDIAISSNRGTLPLVSDGQAATIIVSDGDAPVVRTAAEALASDIELVTGLKPEVKSAGPDHFSFLTSHPSLICGTLGQSPVIDELARKGKIDAKKVRGRWESYGLQVVDISSLSRNNVITTSRKTLVVFGADPRGTAYGLFHLSRLMGVSPWVWWADVTPEHRDALWLSGRKTIVGSPSVKYRGLFINDEDHGLNPWAKRKMDRQRGNIGPNTYARVAELLLRLRANLLWPAMHSCSEAFWANKDNVEVARRYDIVLGSSHCEQMLRDNEWEWRRFGGDGDKDWRWRENRDMISRYWAERVGESRGIDAIYTLGMRGVHDTGMNGYPTVEDKVEGLTDVIAFQRQLLADSIGGGDATRVPQLFIPYKEVLEAYNAGLRVPDDVTICWVDDNHGYMRQLPSPEEQRRSGGNGLYYHLSYLGTPVPWCWLSSVSPALMSFELSKAYSQQVRQMWVINVGDIKPQEAEFEFSMDLAWDVNAWQPDKAFGWTRQWAARTFGEAVADRVAHIKNEYYRLAASGKPEHVYAVPFTHQEQDERISAFRAIIKEVEELKPAIPARLRDAYFELIEYPVLAGGYLNIKIFRDYQALDYARAGWREEALDAQREAQDAYGQILRLTDTYNQSIAHGKWDGMMEYLPWGHGPARRVPLEIIDSIRPERKPILQPVKHTVSGKDYVASSGNLTVIHGLGNSEDAVTVWPPTPTPSPREGSSVTSSNSKTNQSPLPLGGVGGGLAEYLVPVEAGEGQIVVRCLSSFPINASYDLRVAVSVDGGEPQVISVRTKAMDHYGNDWHKTVLAGYSPAAVSYSSPTARTVRVKVWLLDPGVVINDVQSVGGVDSVGDDQRLFIGDSIAIARTEYGRVKGFIKDHIYNFRGIPYAASTAGKNRFMPPQPPKPWSDIRPAVMWGTSAPQDDPQWASASPYHAWQDCWRFYDIGEDCLNLNIWTQGLNDGKRRPVLVWLHGGSWVTGNAFEMDSYQGENITAYGDIVFVSINHRVGPFGLINFGGVDERFRESGNISVLDMVAALRWVHDNIENFGGDPGNVTIMGQSGGGSKVCTLVAMPEIKGLVHKGVALSGSASDAGSAETAANFGQYLVEQSGMTMDELQQMPWREFNALAYRLTDQYNKEQRAKHQPGAGYHPMADGEHIPTGTFYQDATLAGNDIPMLFCSTTGEWSATKHSQGTEDCDREGAIRVVAGRYGRDRAERLVDAYHAVFPERKWGQLIGIIGWNTRGNTIRAVNAKTSVQQAPCYLAWFDWQPPLFDGRAHAFHTIDIGFWLCNTDVMLSHTGGGSRPRALSTKMADALLAFMRTGDPNCPSMPEWKAYNQTDGWTMMLSDDCRLVKDIDREARKNY